MLRDSENCFGPAVEEPHTLENRESASEIVAEFRRKKLSKFKPLENIFIDLKVNKEIDRSDLRSDLSLKIF